MTNVESYEHFFRVNLSSYLSENSGVSFGEGEIVGFLSKFADGSVKVNNTENLRYFKNPEHYPLNLVQSSKGALEEDECLPKKASSIQHTLDFFCSTDQKLHSEDIISSAGCFTKILTTPYDVDVKHGKENWTIQACKLNGKLYLMHVEVLGQRKMKLPVWNFVESGKIDSSFFNFLDFCSTDYPGRPADPKKYLNPTDKFICIFRRQIGDISLVYGAKMNLIQSKENKPCSSVEELEDSKFVAVRVQRPTNKGFFYRKKLLRFYCRFRLSNVKTLYMAHSSDDGIVKQPPEKIEVSSLPRQFNGQWDEKVCLKFLIEFLTKVQALMEKVDDPDKIYEFFFDSKLGCIKYKILDGRNIEMPVLSQNYIKSEQCRKVF